MSSIIDEISSESSENKICSEHSKVFKKAKKIKPRIISYSSTELSEDEEIVKFCWIFSFDFILQHKCKVIFAMVLEDYIFWGYNVFFHSVHYAQLISNEIRKIQKGQNISSDKSDEIFRLWRKFCPTKYFVRRDILSDENFVQHCFVQ